jgi:hypothetical protein
MKDKTEDAMEKLLKAGDMRMDNFRVDFVKSKDIAARKKRVFIANLWPTVHAMYETKLREKISEPDEVDK